MKDLSITFLGSGTSHGVPMINCSCEVCSSENPRDKRLRSSVLITDNRGNQILIDCSKDFREQALRYKIKQVKHVLITHHHADHVFGIDELRIYNKINGEPVKLFVKEEADREIKNIFPYLYSETGQTGGGVTDVENKIIRQDESFSIYGLTITPVPVLHGKLEIFGYRINNIAYLTDTSFIPPESYRLLENLDVLVLGALRFEPHATHFSLDQAIEAAEKIGAQKTYFTHISHKLGHEAVNARLPEGMALSYDGLVI